MNRNAILNWIHEYTPIETDFKNYHDHHKAPISNQEFFDILSRHHGLSGAESPFGNIDPSQISASDTPISSDTDFSDALWLYQNNDVSIRKHPRYFPELIHTHEFIELAYVYEGSCRQTFYHPGSIKEELKLSSGCLCIIPPKSPHSIAVFDDSIVVNILIRASALKHTFANFVSGNQRLSQFFMHTLYEGPQQNYIFFDTRDDELFKNLIIDMMLESCEDKAYSQKVLFLQLGLFFTYLQRDYTDTIRFSSTATSEIRYIPQILDYLQNNYATTSVEDIAAHFYLSKSYLSRIFKANTNLTIVQTLQQFRIQKATELLETSRLSVSQISEVIGYSDVTFFIRLFKKLKGITPLQYRNTYQH